MASLRAAGFGHQNVVMRIPRPIKLYDFYVHVQGDNLFFRFDDKNSVALTRGWVSRPQGKSTKILRCVFVFDAYSLNHTIFLCRGRAIFQNLSFIFEKFFYAKDRMYFPAAELEHWNPATRILGGLKSYDFSVHGPGDFSKFIRRLRKILSIRREDAFSGCGVGALKPCDAYSRSTKIVRSFCAWAGRFFKIYPSFSKNSFTPTGGCVFRPRSWSTKITRRVFLEH